jgi:hypothetical protein
MILSDLLSPAEALSRMLGGFLRAGGKPAFPFRDHASLLGRGDRSGRLWAARIVPIRHALLEESVARRALQFLVVRAEFARCHFLLRIDRKTRPR